MQNLIDGDLAANNGGWQWTAGASTDAAPYFRIFNPVTQSSKFDPDGEFIRRWVPELAAVENKFLHAPWEMSPADQKQCGVIIGRNYPAPFVDLKLSRQRALDTYKPAANEAECLAVGQNYICSALQACVIARKPTCWGKMQTSRTNTPDDHLHAPMLRCQAPLRHLPSLARPRPFHQSPYQGRLRA